MITKHDWNDALDAWIVEERERLGGPPSPEEIVAYLSGARSGDEAARVRALLVYYPELTPLLTERVERPRAPRRSLALRAYALAATLIMAMLFADAIHLRRKSNEPAVLSARHEFNPFLGRGPAPEYELRGGAQRYLITAVPSEALAAEAYDVEITRGSRVLWRARGVQPVANAFVIDIPGEFLTPGTYSLNVREDGRLVDHYPFRVTE